LLSVLSKMFLFFSFSVSQYFIFSILYNVPCTYLSLHAYCNDCLLPAWRINFFILPWVDMITGNVKAGCKLVCWSDSCASQNEKFFIICLWQYLVQSGVVGQINHKANPTSLSNCHR